MILKTLSYLYYRFPYLVLERLYRNNSLRKHETSAQTMLAMCKISEEYTGHYYSFRERPQKTNEVQAILQNNEYAKCAIVLQGPIMSDDNFTVETVKLYKRFYPSDIILVSTWSDELAENIKAVQDAGAIVVQSDKPAYGGHGNINYQIVNTREGVFKAKELGAEYICKTRTDQRIYHPSVFEYMVSLLNMFPPVNTDASRSQNRRVICCCMEYGTMFYPFFMSDFFYFGTVDEITSMFDCQLDMRQNVDKAKGYTRREAASKDLVSEIQILRQYAKKMGCSDECTVENYWKFIKNHLVCINKDSIGLYWPKYETRYSENIRNGYFYNNEPENYFKTYNWDFIHWLNLYNGTLNYKPEYEKYADLIIL